MYRLVDIQEMAVDKLQEKFQVDVNVGLKQSEVKERLKRYGRNELVEAKRNSRLLMFFGQFNDFMVYVLIVAVIVSAFLGEVVDAIAIMAIVIVNGILGFVQENKAEKSLSALKSMSSPSANVLRDGKWEKIPSQEIVLGDVIKFSSGNRIGADLRITTAKGLEIEESALTGESIPTTKRDKPVLHATSNLGDQMNMAFMGTLVTRGSGVGIVVSTGMETAMGKIANLLQTAESGETPLQNRLAQLGKALIVIALSIALLIVLIGIYQGNSVHTMILSGVSLAVAAIPEGLPAIVTVALSLGVQKMIRKKALVRKLPVVETIGCASVICSDKTGTMTENKMTVTKLWASGYEWQVEGIGYTPNGKIIPNRHAKGFTSELKKLITYGVLCSNAEINFDGKNYTLDGDPTEAALIISGMKAGIERAQLKNEFTQIKEFPFDNVRKRMSVVVSDAHRRLVITKGAPDYILEKCNKILVNEKEVPMSKNYKDAVTKQLSEMNKQSLRTIAVAYRGLTLSEEVKTEYEAENNLVFVGLQGMIDPPRPEVKIAVRKCAEAGIKTVMITGDHKETAMAIAKELDILHTNDLVLTGQELDLLDDGGLSSVVDSVSVFARVTPEHKLRIVKAYKNRGHIVAMTGDGVNDSPAIKAADIGIAMGITGTDVAKEASDLVLLDDHFATIRAAVHEGRNIYENIRKFIRYLLASNTGEILVMFFAMLMGLPLPLLPIHILWVNLVTDGLPAMALGLDRPEGNIMKHPPRSAKESVFARGLGWKILSRGFLIGAVTVGAFMVIYRGSPANLEHAQTIAFLTIVLAQLVHVFDCRSEVSIFARNPLGNIYLIFAVISSLLLMLPVIYYPPLQSVFHTVSVGVRDWLLVIGLSALPTFLLAGGGLFRKNK